MIRRVRWSALLAGVSLAVFIAQAAHADDRPIHVNLFAYLGSKNLNNNDWGTNDRQTAAGVSFDVQPPGSPLCLVVEGVLAGDTHDTGILETKSTTGEYAIGVRNYWNFGERWSLYGGLGPELVAGRIEISGIRVTAPFTLQSVETSDSDTGVGFWVGSGVLYHPTSKLHVGVNVRYSKGKIELFNQDRDAGGLLVNLVAGVRFQ
jgi:opacity protein-like surface antigen